MSDLPRSTTGVRHPRRIAAAAIVALLGLATACGGSGTEPPAPAPASSTPVSSSVAPSTSASSRPTPPPSPSRQAASTSANGAPPPLSAPRSSVPRTQPPTAAVPPGGTVPPGTGPVIVIDPGHSVTVSATDPATGLDVSDYENEPEMRDVFDVAQLVRAGLQAVGYRVVLTKNSLNQPTSLGQRAAVANSVHAALALSIHDQAGNNGGIGFTAGNNIVYTQAVGDYRNTPAGKRITFTNSQVAALSQRYGQIFQQQRSAAQGASVRLQSNVGYDLGSRGLPVGNIWIVQLLSQVPWVYNEAGGNSAGMSGLNAADKQRYANGLVAAVEQCVPVR